MHVLITKPVSSWPISSGQPAWRGCGRFCAIRCRLGFWLRGAVEQVGQSVGSAGAEDQLDGVVRGDGFGLGAGNIACS